MLTNCLVACAHLTITVSEIQRDICEKIEFGVTPQMLLTQCDRRKLITVIAGLCLQHVTG